MSRLVQLDPAFKQEPEPEGYQFGQPLKKEPAEEVVAMIQEGTDSENEPIPPDPKVTWGVTPLNWRKCSRKTSYVHESCRKWLSKERKLYTLIT